MSEIRDEAKRQFYRLSKVFIPVPQNDATEEYLNAFCEAGNVATVVSAGDRLMAGHPYDRDGGARRYFPNTAEIAAVIADLLRTQQVEWKPERYASDTALFDGWFIADLCDRPEMLHKWLAMRDNPPGRGSHARSQREIAAKIIKACEDYLGQAL